MPSHELDNNDKVTIKDVWDLLSDLNKKVDRMKDVLESEILDLEDQLNNIYREVR